MWRWLLLLVPSTAFADSVVATRVIRAQSVIVAEDLTLVAADIPGALNDLKAAIGQEARVAIYAGRPVGPDQVGAPALVDRNQIVPLIYNSGLVVITTEGRALARGKSGDLIRVMNLSSRVTVTGRVTGDGSITVGDNF